jgi:hypothetical protein
MFEREDLVGIVLLGACAVVGGVLVYSIATGTRFRYTGPDWLVPVLGVLFLGAAIYGLVTSIRRGGRRWPDPATGRGGWRWPWSRKDPGDN